MYVFIECQGNRARVLLLHQQRNDTHCIIQLSLTYFSLQVKKLERTDEESTTSSLVTTALVESPPHSGVGSVSSNGSRSESSLLACGSGCSGSDSGKFHATNIIKCFLLCNSSHCQVCSGFIHRKQTRADISVYKVAQLSSNFSLHFRVKPSFQDKLPQPQVLHLQQVNLFLVYF